MSQNAECIDKPRTLEFPIVLLEPPAWWNRSDYFDANDLDEIAEEMAYRLGRDEDDLEPEASFRRFHFRGSAGRFGVYVHECGELLEPRFVAIVVTPADQPYIDYGPDYGPDNGEDDDKSDDPDANTVRAFARVAGISGIGLTANDAAAEVIRHLPYSWIPSIGPQTT